MSIKCGSCGERHETVAEVRQCSSARFYGEAAERGTIGREEADRYTRNAARTNGVRTGREATPRMVTFVRDLARTRDMTPADLAAATAEPLGFAEARRLIETYKDARRVDRSRTEPVDFTSPRPEPKADLVDGMYRNPATGDIFKVYHTVHGANQQVAKRLKILDETEWYGKIVRGTAVTVKAVFEYEGKTPLADLTPEMRMTLEQAKEYGAVYGVCIRCAATLTKETSIERSMGDTCASKANWA